MSPCVFSLTPVSLLSYTIKSDGEEQQWRVVHSKRWTTTASVCYSSLLSGHILQVSSNIFGHATEL